MPTTYRSILHPSDLVEGSRLAFQHSLALCLFSQGELSILHSEDPDHRKHWGDLPRVRETLAEWGRLPHDAPKEAVADLHIHISKFKIPSDDPSRAIVEAVRTQGPDLLVMATHAREGWSRLVHSEIAEPVLRRSGLPGLLFPPHCSGFLDAATGATRLERVLLAVAPDPSPSAAVEEALSLVQTAGAAQGVLREVYVGAADERPQTSHPQVEGWTWERAELSGPVAPALCQEAQRWGAQVLVMSSRGRDTLRDYLLGSCLDQVLPHCPCPVLVVPVD